MDRACLSCHKEIDTLIARGRGLHAKEGKAKCASCHPDHAGVNFALINFKGDSVDHFDHKRTNWALEGKHADTKCKDCHKAEYRKGEIASLSVRKTGVGYLGLERECLACHEDYHKTSLGKNCVRCHDIKDWKPAPLFDHDTSSTYPLTGKHKDVKCEKCHNVERLHPEFDKKGKIIPVFKPVAHKDCVACHADVHKGQLKGACDGCHKTSGWHDISQKGFDHDKTRYPLRGRHADVSCNKCHIGFPNPKDWKPVFGKCADCHKDPHEGKATLVGKIVDCEACHVVADFKPSTYTVSDHAKAKYPLEGKHQSVKCGDCHKTRTVSVASTAPNAPRGALMTMKLIDMRPKFANCTTCHDDQHAGQLATRTDKGACESCHKVAGWKVSTYAIAEHAKLRLPLEGRHAEIECGACHSADRPGLPTMTGVDKLGKAKVLFKVTEIDCAACHGDAHGGRFTKAGPKGTYAAGCKDCHNAKKFRPSNYDYVMHAKSGFPLDGAHRAVSCVACHDEMKQPFMKNTLLIPKVAVTMPFSQHRTTCAACHDKESPHGTQFAHRKDKGACEGCHGADSFSPAVKFDHTKDATFSTKGAHEKVPCGDCHIPPKGVKPAEVKYSPLSGKCESCHSNPVRQ